MSCLLADALENATTFPIVPDVLRQETTFHDLTYELLHTWLLATLALMAIFVNSCTHQVKSTLTLLHRFSIIFANATTDNRIDFFTSKTIVRIIESHKMFLYNTIMKISK